MVTCTRCGTEAREGARFCGVCGQPIAASTPAPSGKVTVAPLGKSVGTLAGTAGAVPGGGPTPLAPAPDGSSRRAAMIAGGVLLVSVLVLAAVLVTRSGSDGASTAADGDAASSTDGDAGDGDDAGSSSSDAGDDGDDGTSGSDADPSDPAPTTQPAVVEILTPVRVTPTNTRDAVELRCGGTADYGAWNLFDSDPNTGWGASAADGAGESVTVDFGRSVHLARVGITPGFTKFGPRADQGCASVNAFPFNRFVAEVRWSFDGGPPITQTFQPRGSMQTVPVDVTTGTLTMTILRTQYQGVDTDTVISSMEVRGSR